MAWIIPSNVIKGGNVAVIPQFSGDQSFANLAIGAAYTSVVFSVQYNPLFDISVYADQALSLQAQARYQGTGPGSTWRNVGDPYITVVNDLKHLTGIRVSNYQVRWVLTNNSGVATLTMEFVILNRNL